MHSLRFQNLLPALCAEPENTPPTIRTACDLPLLKIAISFSATGGWQNWTTIETQVELDAGPQVIRAVNAGASTDGFNFNWFELEALQAGCSGADLAEPFGVLDFSDVVAFLTAFGANEPAADLAEPFGAWDFSDVIGFLASFGAGCP